MEDVVVEMEEEEVDVVEGMEVEGVEEEEEEVAVEMVAEGKCINLFSIF